MVHGGLVASGYRSKRDIGTAGAIDCNDSQRQRDQFLLVEL